MTTIIKSIVCPAGGARHKSQGRVAITGARFIYNNYAFNKNFLLVWSEAEKRGSELPTFHVS